MATKIAGGRIRGYIALTLEATAEVEVGDPVQISGDYECVRADGTATVVGQVSTITQNFPAGGGTRVATVPGDVAVEAFGHSVLTFRTAANTAITAGDLVGANADGQLVAAGAGVATIGVALHGVTAEAGVRKNVDVLCMSGL